MMIEKEQVISAVSGYIRQYGDLITPEIFLKIIDAIPTTEVEIVVGPDPRDKEIDGLRNIIATKDGEIQGREDRIGELNKFISSMENARKVREERIGELEGMIRSLENEMKVREERIAVLEDQVQEKEAVIRYADAKAKEVEAYRLELMNREKKLRLDVATRILAGVVASDTEFSEVVSAPVGKKIPARVKVALDHADALLAEVMK